MTDAPDGRASVGSVGLFIGFGVGVRIAIEVGGLLIGCFCNVRVFLVLGGHHGVTGAQMA